MPRLRLFANLREAAGTSEARLPGATVAEVLDGARARFGSDFAAGLEAAKVWVNGDPTTPEAPVGEDDEIALIPPVSGGTTMVRSPLLMEIGLFLILVGALVGANQADLRWFAVALVLAGSLWAYDLVDFAGRRGLGVPIYPPLAAVLGSVLATYRWGVAGMAAATVGALLVALTTAVLVPRLRPVELVTASALLSTAAAFGIGSMLLLRMRNPDESLAFLVVAGVAVTAAWLAGQREVTGVDPVVVTLLVGIVMGVVAATVWAEDDVLPMIVAALAASVALVAGRNVGSLIRAGGFFSVGAVPGALHGFDSILLAAGPFWLILFAFT